MKNVLFLVMFVFFACGGQSDNSEKTNTTPAKTLSDARQSHGNMSWEPSDGWIAEPVRSNMRKAQYRLPKAESDSEDATVVIYYFEGEGGGVRANIDRWVKQFKAPGSDVVRNVTEKELGEVNGMKQTMIQVDGVYLYKPMPMAPKATEKPGFRMLAAVIESDAGPWFAKFVGPTATVEKWQESFKAFLSTFEKRTAS